MDEGQKQVLEKLEDECARRAALLMRACTAIDDANGWLAGLEASFASPNRVCAQAETGEHNACIEIDPGELEFPDDWCERCYILKCVREARAALAVRSSPTEEVSPPSPSNRPPPTEGETL